MESRPNITTALDVLTQAADTVKVTDRTRRALALLSANIIDNIEQYKFNGI